MQNRSDIRNQLIELHLAIYDKRLFLKNKFRPLWRKSLKIRVISYFSNATKDFDLIKHKSVPVLCLHVNLSLAIDIILHQWEGGGRGWRLPRITACAMLWVSQKLSFLTRNRSFCEHIDVLAKIQGDIRNQRMKLRRVMCDTIHFLAKTVFRKISLGSPTDDFCKKNNFSKNGLFWQSWFSQWYITHSEQ